MLENNYFRKNTVVLLLHTSCFLLRNMSEQP